MWYLRLKKEIRGIESHETRTSLGIFVEWKGKMAEDESLRKTDILWAEECDLVEDQLGHRKTGREAKEESVSRFSEAVN